ncbi:MAG: type II toxin-antitoxin system HicB family antitoxin [Dehalococcoidia bacterium]|nr:type II toxin-antitoxin system HicB family antitoxin [Dehalococcoidia bacterium]
MRLFRLPVVLFEPSEYTEDKFMVEVPLLPGCRAWGDTPAQALENLQSVAAGFIESYRESGDPLPPEVEALATSLEDKGTAEVLVAG